MKPVTVAVIVGCGMCVVLAPFYTSRDSSTVQISAGPATGEEPPIPHKLKEYKVKSTKYVPKKVTAQLRKRVIDKCQQLGDVTERKDCASSINFVWGHKYGFVLCEAPFVDPGRLYLQEVLEKATASNLLNQSVPIDLLPSSESYIEQYPDFVPPEHKWEKNRLLKKLLSLTLVRHPLDRILLAYVARSGSPSYRRLRDEMGYEPTFVEYFSAILKWTEGVRNATDWRQAHLLDIMPHHVSCSVCCNKFKKIIKVEDMFMPRGHAIDLSSQRALYYPELADKDLSRIENIYRTDLDLYNYGIEDFRRL